MKKINPRGGVEKIEKEVGASQMANGSEYGHKSLLGFLFKNDETSTQWSQGNSCKVTQSEGADHGVWMLFHCLSVCFSLMICLNGYFLPFFLSLQSSYPSCIYLDLQLSIAKWWERLTELIVAQGSRPDWAPALSLLYSNPVASWVFPPGAPWNASIFYPQDGIQKLLHSCRLCRVAEHSAVWYNGTTSTSVPGHHSFEKCLHTMLILERFLKS